MTQMIENLKEQIQQLFLEALPAFYESQCIIKPWEGSWQADFKVHKSEYHTYIILGRSSGGGLFLENFRACLILEFYCIFMH